MGIVNSKKAYHRKAKTGFVRCEGRQFRVHDNTGKPFDGEVTLRLQMIKPTAHSRNNVFEVLQLTEVTENGLVAQAY